MRTILLAILFARAFTPAFAQEAANGWSLGEEQNIGRWVEEQQLGIFESKQPGNFLAVNHGGGYEVAVDPLGFEIRSGSSQDCWAARSNFSAWGRTGAVKPWEPVGYTHSPNELRVVGPGLDVQYLHGRAGLRQNFQVHERPAGCGRLLLDLETSGDLTPVDGPEGIEFKDANGETRSVYRDLHVWDDCGQVLNARMSVVGAGRTIRIEVDDAGASYPIVIDPVATTQNILIAGPLNGGQFGIALRTAGDLNGDGYSDVVVAAPYGAMGESGEGIVYVFYGSPTGIAGAADVILQADQVSAVFGYSVGTAGDVNGDGYSDLLVGASSWESDASTNEEGGVFVYHGSATGISTTPAIILQPNTALVYMGYSVACAGDINNDGYSDIITGAPYAAFPSSLEGAAYVFLGGPGGLTNVYHKRLERNQGAAQFGQAIAGLGDVNGDGYSDIGVTAFRYDQAGVDDGIVCIYHGSAVGIAGGANPNPNTIITATGYTSNIGWSIGPAGDVNGDGYSDVVVGDTRATVAGLTNAGGMFVYHGSAAGVIAAPATVYHYPVASTLFGRSVFTAGDVNSDGYADIIVGATTFTNGQVSEGAAFVFLGSSTGIVIPQFLRYESNVTGNLMGECVSTAGDVNGDGFSDMLVGIKAYLTSGGASVYHGGGYSLATTPSFTRSSALTGALLGTSVADAGDINGDGYSDVVVGAPGASNGQAGEGLAYIHYGSSGGLSMIPSLTLEANVAGASFGFSVASAGDVNGDGYADVIIGAPNSGGVGRAYVYHGGPGGLNPVAAFVRTGAAGSTLGYSVHTAGDVNSDGFSDVLIGVPVNDIALLHWGGMGGVNPVEQVTLTGAPGSRFGAAVCTAGDVNGSGYSDVIIGAPMFTNGQVNEGGAFIYHGSQTGLVNVVARQLEPNLANAAFGTSVAGVGDVNGNGFYEVAVGAPNWAGGQANEGAAFIYWGTSTGITTAGFVFFQSNQVNANMGLSVAEGGDLNGDGYADILIGAPYFANGQVDEGRVWVVEGAAAGIGPVSSVESNVAGWRLGWSVAGGGDVNGDGYSDAIGGAPNASPGFLDEGAFLLYHGNRNQSTGYLTRQYLANLVSPLSTNNYDNTTPDWFGIGHVARSPIQRTRGKLRWEVVFEGQPFTGAPINTSMGFTGQSAGWTDLGLSGVELKELVYKTPGHLRYKWRVRVEYPLNKLIDGQRFSRWFYGYASAVGDIGVLPVELLSFTGEAERAGNRLKWTTASEAGSDRFILERSSDGLHFEDIGELAAAGNSRVPIDYEWLDDHPSPGTVYYRLRMRDLSGDEELSDLVVIGGASWSLLVRPNPATDRIDWGTMTQSSTWRILDAMGRTALTGRQADGQPGQASIKNLQEGTYSLEVTGSGGGSLFHARFVKTHAPIAR
ncbi:MAG: FG-GAP repeat protein [Flavobacteriales bacterium]|nr:FG-GAP repeat protein [Flavobacteriales bacterium]